MKKIAYSLFAAAFVALSGCQDDVVVEEPVVPAQTGDEITFGSSLENTGVDTRTVYGDEPVNGAYPVYWEADGSDQISIYCPEAAQGKVVSYKVTPQNPNEMYDGSQGDQSKSLYVTKVNSEEAGLQWGSNNKTHHFSAFYPASGILGNQDGKLKGFIPVEQDPVEWKMETNEAGGKTYTGVANTDYAFMWAYNTHNPQDGGDVPLIFKPWVTILDVEINGPATAGEKIKMSSVQLRSLSNETLTGEFLIDFNPVEDNEKNAPVYEAVDDVSSTRNQISIEFYANEIKDEDRGGTTEKFNDYITLEHNDKIVVRFYLLPKDVNYDTSIEGRNDLQIRVTPFNSAVLTRTLNAQGGSQTGGILAHKVNKVILPSVSNEGESLYFGYAPRYVILPSVSNEGPNYWMSSLDPNIFITELSLPGSKMSYQTRDNVDGWNAVYYQSLSISEQIQNGIRAFQIQTASTDARTGESSDASEQDLYMTVAGNKRNIRFREIVEEIATGLKAAKTAGRNNEYAFILLTPSLDACDGYNHWNGPGDRTFVSGKQAWMDAIRNELAFMAQDEDTYRLYTGEITPNTTIDNVKGHVIIKVNYNDDEMANHLNESDRIPAMFAQWGIRNDIPLDFKETDAYAINAMRWGTSYNASSSDLQWFYHEATPVGYNGASGGDYGESSTVKIANIEDMWNRSIEYYSQNEYHNIWYLNDLGGCYVNGDYSSGETQGGVDAWTEFIGPYATDLLQNRNADATLGIVLMNQVSDDPNAYTSNLVQTIINNNFNFQLRTSGSSEAKTYSIPARASSNGWDE